MKKHRLDFLVNLLLLSFLIWLYNNGYETLSFSCAVIYAFLGMLSDFLNKVKLSKQLKWHL